MHDRTRQPEEKRRREALDERDVRGLDEMRPDEQAEVIEAAESNPDTITRRETIEQELMELGRSEAGENIGD